MPTTSKKSNDQPVAAEAQGALAKAEKFASVLRETHHAISRALSEEQRLYGAVGAAEVSGGDADVAHARLDTTRRGREADVRRRSAAAEGLLELGAELRSVRAQVEQKRAELAGEVVSEFVNRWNSCCRELASLYNEGAQLSSVLRAKVPTPPPYSATTNIVTGVAEVRLSWPLESQSVTLPPELAAVSTTIDRLDAALALIAGIRQTQQLDERCHALSLQRGTAREFAGAYRVAQMFTCLSDGLNFEAGELVDASLCGPGTLQRLSQSGRFLRPVTLEHRAA